MVRINKIKIMFIYIIQRVLWSPSEIEVIIEGILAVDLPNGLKTGDKIQLKGKSVFRI